MQNLTGPGRGYFFYGGVILTVIMIAFFVAGAWGWGLFALAAAISEFGVVAWRIRRDGR